MLLELGDTAGAVEAFRSAVMTDPTNTEAASGLAAATAPTQPAAGSGHRLAVGRPRSPRRRMGRGVSIAKRMAVVVWLLFGVVTSLLVMASLLRGGDTDETNSSTLASNSVEGGAVTTVASSTTAAPVPSDPAALPPPTTVAPATAPPATAPPATDAPAVTPDPFEPEFFATADEAIADWLSALPLPYGGTCASLAGREVELGGAVVCSQLVEDLVPAQIHTWGVFATDDFGGWILVDVGSAGWSVADESLELERPDW